MTRDVDFPEGGAEPESKQYIVRIRTRSGEYEGIMYSPHPERRLAEALGAMDAFINLKDARDVVSKEKFPFMVINKEHIETVKVLDER